MSNECHGSNDGDPFDCSRPKGGLHLDSFVLGAGTVTGREERAVRERSRSDGGIGLSVTTNRNTLFQVFLFLSSFASFSLQKSLFPSRYVRSLPLSCLSFERVS